MGAFEGVDSGARAVSTRDDDGNADGEEEVFVRRRGAFAKDRKW